VSENETCQVEMHGGQPCGRRAVSRDEKGNKVCLLHRSVENESCLIFQGELDEVFSKSDATIYDLTGVRFPKEGWEIPKDVIDKPIYFTDCVFHGDFKFTQICKEAADFTGSEFKGRTEVQKPDSKVTYQFESFVNFANTTFHGDVLFSTHLGAGANFQDATFGGDFVHKFSGHWGTVSFQKCNFSGVVRFYSCRFHSILGGTQSQVTFCGSTFGKAVLFRSLHFNCPVDFDECTFCQEATFDHCYFDISGISRFTRVVTEQPEKVRFLSSNLSHVEFSGTELSKLHFNIITWNRTSGSILSPSRLCVYDEMTPGSWETPEEWQRLESIAQVYRGLQQSYCDSLRYSEAADFFIGEQEMVRKAKGKFRRFVCLNFLYKIASNYGESYRRPFAGLVLTLVLFPVVFSFFHLRPNLPEKPLFDLLVDNLGFMTFSRTGMFEYFPDRITRLLVITESIIFVSLATLFLLSLRRKFKRKSF
jgi:uncharacterized protein YjbI with pentapeptide repeats